MHFSLRNLCPLLASIGITCKYNAQVYIQAKHTNTFFFLKRWLNRLHEVQYSKRHLTLRIKTKSSLTEKKIHLYFEMSAILIFYVLLYWKSSPFKKFCGKKNLVSKSAPSTYQTLSLQNGSANNFNLTLQVMCHNIYKIYFEIPSYYTMLKTYEVST